MNQIRAMKQRVEALVKQAAPGVTVQRLFYDEISDRLFVSLVKGPRKIEFVINRNAFADGELRAVKQAIEGAVGRLDQTPIG